MPNTSEYTDLPKFGIISQTTGETLYSCHAANAYAAGELYQVAVADALPMQDVKVLEA